jgi:phage terminase large subunit
VADSAEPKCIDDIASYGIAIIPCTKGRDSVKRGIDLVQDQRCSVTKRSVNIIKEYRNYMWEVDKDGKVLNLPEPGYDHSMDAIRYAIESMPKLVRPLTAEQKRTRTFMAAMERKRRGMKEGAAQGSRGRFISRK